MSVEIDWDRMPRGSKIVIERGISGDFEVRASLMRAGKVYGRRGEVHSLMPERVGHLIHHIVGAARRSAMILSGDSS